MITELMLLEIEKPYLNTVYRWCTLDNTLPHSDTNRVTTASQKTIQRSQLYRCAKLCGDADDIAVICSKNGVDSIVDAVY